MATDLFNNYYDNPQRQAIYTNLSCPSAKSETDMTFSFNGGDGIISDSRDVLSNINMSNIKSTINEWNNSSEIIPANSIIYLKGKSYGDSYKRIVYGKFIPEILNYSFTDEIKLNFVICYNKDNNCPCSEVISVNGYSLDDIINKVNEIFNDMKINVDMKVISYDNSNDNNLLSFESNKLGYDFYVDNVSYYIMAKYICDDEVHQDIYDNYIEFPMEESLALYIPAKKYRNGAFKGLIIVPSYPKFNNDIPQENKSLMITHLTDRVNMYYKCNDMYKRYIFDVFGDLSIVQEYENCIIFRDKHYYDDFDLSDLWLNDDDKDNFQFINNGMKILSNKVLGIYGYCNYATINSLWQNFGDVYCMIAAPDIENSDTYNYINSAIIYNPNNFDIKLNILYWN